MMEQLNMFEQMGCPITPLQVICEHIRDYWEDECRDRRSLQEDPDEDGPEYLPDPDLRCFARGLFSSWYGGCGGMDRYGIHGWQFSPGRVKVVRMDGSTVEYTQAQVLRELGIEERYNRKVVTA